MCDYVCIFCCACLWLDKCDSLFGNAYLELGGSCVKILARAKKLF